ncbi:MAG: hypothetical protein HZB83_02650 [Deltaproteobacteria bacterium]|nr:hypothetical protein [Deltaproteobacteria bacterium]
MAKNILLSALAGALWGLIAMAVNGVTNAFPFESGLLHNLVAFTFSGAVMGAVAGGFLGLAGARLPFKSTLPKAVLVSTIFWLFLRVAGAALSRMDSERYHAVTLQTMQGLVLAVVLGCILGLLWSRGSQAASGQIPQRTGFF